MIKFKINFHSLENLISYENSNVRPVSGIHDGEDDRLTNTRSRFEKVPEEPTVALPPPQEPSGKLYEVSRDIHEQPTEINSGNEDKPLKQYDPTRDIHGNFEKLAEIYTREEVRYNTKQSNKQPGKIPNDHEKFTQNPSQKFSWRDQTARHYNSDESVIPSKFDDQHRSVNDDKSESRPVEVPTKFNNGYDSRSQNELRSDERPSTQSNEDSGIPNLKYKKEFITKESDAKLKDRYQRVNSRYRDSQDSFRNRQNYQETVYGLPEARNVKYNPVGEFFTSIINYFRFHNQEIFPGFKFRFQMKIIKFSKPPDQPQS